MKTSLDCLLCFMRQARSLGIHVSDNPAVQRRLLDEAGQFIASVDTDLAPPENAGRLYSILAQALGTADPFAQMKEESNALALSLRKEIRQQIEQYVGKGEHQTARLDHRQIALGYRIDQQLARFQQRCQKCVTQRALDLSGLG